MLDLDKAAVILRRPPAGTCTFLDM